MTEQGRKFDGGKLRYDLLPVHALEEVTRVIVSVMVSLHTNKRLVFLLRKLGQKRLPSLYKERKERR